MTTDGTEATEGLVEKKYTCQRCEMTKRIWVSREKAKKTIKCPYCDTGRMRLEGLMPATGWRTKSQRNK